MERTIKIGDKDVRLNNNIGWAIAYRDQFGRDIIPALMPMLAGALDVVSGIVNETGKTENIDTSDLLKVLDGDAFLDAVFHLGALEFVDFINMVWALAKCADDDIPEPKVWVKQFEVFPLDKIVPVVAELVLAGVMSSKNLERLKNAKKTLQPKKSASTTSSSPVSNEVSQ